MFAVPAETALSRIDTPLSSGWSPRATAQVARATAPVAEPEVLQLVTKRADFEALEAEWTALFDRAGRSEQMFQTFNWLWHWANHFTPEDTRDLAIVTIRRHGRLVGVLPLAIERMLGLRQLVFMGAPVSQYGDAVIEAMVSRDDVLARALDFAIVEARVDVVRLAKVRDDAAIAVVAARGAAFVTGAEEAPYIDIATAGTFAAYEQRFSTKARKNRRRLERRLEERGRVEATWNLTGKVGADAAIATLTLKRAWLKSRGQLSRAFADPCTDRFFAAIAAAEQRPVGAAIALLTSKGEIANAAISVVVKGRQALHILAYGLKFEKCAAGILHVEKLIAHAFENGVTTFDFLAPRHDYKLEWADGAVRVADYALPVTRAGTVYARVYLAFVRETLKAALKAAPGVAKAPLSLVQRYAGAIATWRR